MFCLSVAFEKKYFRQKVVLLKREVLMDTFKFETAGAGLLFFKEKSNYSFLRTVEKLSELHEPTFLINHVENKYSLCLEKLQLRAWHAITTLFLKLLPN